MDRPESDLELAVAKIAREFRAGFEKVALIDRPAVSLFGSARVPETHPAYAAARAVGRRFAEHGWAVITGRASNTAKFVRLNAGRRSV